MAKKKRWMVFQKKLIDEINNCTRWDDLWRWIGQKLRKKILFVLEANKNPEKPNESQSTEPVKEMMEEVDKQTLEKEKKNGGNERSKRGGLERKRGSYRYKYKG